MKILHIIDSGGLYGAEIMLLHLMRAQVDLGLEPVLASIGEPGEKQKPLETEARRMGLLVEAFRMRNGPNWPGALKILRFARDNSMDLLHTHGYKGNILFGLLPLSLRRLPMVATVHGWTWTGGWSRMRVYEWLDGLSLRFADGVVLVNQAMRSHARVKQLRTERTAVIDNGVSLNYCHAQKAKLRDDIVRFAGQGFSVVFVGRLSREKGISVLIDAVSGLALDGINPRLIIIGEGKLRKELEQQAQDLGIEDRVLFTGYIDNVHEYLGNFNLFCLPSLTEGLPMVLLEAMAAQVPIVASSVGGIPEVLDHGRAGTLVKPGCSLSLKNAVLGLLDRPDSISAQVQEAARRVEDVYSSRTMAEKYKQVYQNMALKNA